MIDAPESYPYSLNRSYSRLPTRASGKLERLLALADDGIATLFQHQREVLGW